MGQCYCSSHIVQLNGKDKGEVKCRIGLRPWDTFGCWYNNNYLISSDHEWLAHTVSTNKLWMNKVDYSMDADPALACMRQLYRTHNAGGSTAKNLMVVPLPR